MQNRKANSYERGFTFIELVIVIGLVGIFSAFTISNSFLNSSPVNLLSLAEQASYSLTMVVLKAKSSQSTVSLACSTKGISANFYKSTKSISMRSNSIGYSLDAVTRIANAQPTWTENVASLPQKGVAIECPSSCGKIYITSDGSVIPTVNCSMNFTFTSTGSETTQSKVFLKKTGFTEIYVRSTKNISGSWAWIPR
jgi:prepilin-type N-terminal cleavage/methylation domain-containing protein